MLAHLLSRTIPIPRTEDEAKEDPQWILIVDVTDSIDEPYAITFNDPTKIPWKQGFRLRFVPEPTAIKESVELLLQSVRAHGMCWVWIDEVNAVSTSHNTPPTVLWLTLQARKFGVGCCNVTPRPRGIDPSFMGMAQHLFTFLLTDPDDIKHIAGPFGSTPSEMKDLLYSLDDFAYIWYDVRARTRYIMPPIPQEYIEILNYG